MTVFVSGAFLSCLLDFIEPDKPGSGSKENSSANSSDRRTFYAVNFVTNKYYSVSAEKKYDGSHCIIYVENGSGLTVETAKTIANEYDQRIYGKITGAFGEVLDVDSNGKVIFLLLDIKDGYTPGSSDGYIGGYFSPNDMQNNPYSNKADMLYIDIYPQVSKSEGFYSTMAHELQHLIHYSKTTAIGKPSKDTWINEGLSTAAEYLYKGEDPNQRVNYTLMTNYPEYFSGASSANVRQQETFFVWESHLENYAQDFLFFQWLRIHAKDGEKIYKRILEIRKGDFQAVLDAVNDSTYGFTEKNDGKDWDWQSLLRAWFVSNYRYKETFPGYKDQNPIAKQLDNFNQTLKQKGISTTVTSLITPWKGWQDQKKTSISLKNGQGVLVNYTQNFTQTSGNVTYTGIKSDGTLSNSFTTDMPIIVFNHNSSSSTTTVNAALPTVSTAPATSRSAGPSFEPFLPVPAGMIDAIVP